LVGSGFYDQLRRSHRGWIEEYWGNGAKSRQGEWRDSIVACPVKSEIFKAHFAAEKDDIALKTAISGMLVLNIQRLIMARPRTRDTA
jgi:hypothetical protein